MKYEDLANSIIKHVGGEKNISAFTHCMTRLRFNLKIEDKADSEAIKKLQGVVGCVVKGGQFQVVIGPHVEQVYNEIANKVHVQDGEENSENKGFINNLFDTIAGIFMPIVGALAGSGMVKAVLSVCTTFNWVSKDSQTYEVLYMISDCVFYFLPFFIAISAAKKFKCNQYLALIFAAMLVHPTFVAYKAAGDAVLFLGIPLRLATYSSSVVPIILIVFFQSYVERFTKKISPNAIKVFFVPMITIFVVAPVGLLLLGPLGAILGDYLASFFTFLNSKANWIVPTLVGGLAPLLVMTGMHYSVGAVQSAQRASMGYATILAPGMMASNMAQAAATFAVSIKSKNKDIKALASSCAATAICGITEPALYGVTLKYKKPLYATMLAGGIAGFYAGITGSKAWSAGTSNIFSLPIYIGEDNSFMHMCIATGIALVLGFIFSYVLYKDEDTPNTNDETPTPTNILPKDAVTIASALNGTIIALEDVNDDAFSSLALGKGIAVQPRDGIVYAPFDGKVEMLFKTKHAIGLVSKENIEVLIHIGIDTVKLNGEYFESFVSANEEIKKGQKLIQFDVQKMRELGYDCITPIIITNSSQYLDVIETDSEMVEVQDTLLTILP